MKNAISYFVRNPLFAWLAITFLFLAGGLAVVSMRSAAFPDVDFQQAKITTVFPGAPPADVEQLVTIPIEEKIKEVDGLEEVQSVSRQSVSEITVKVDLEEDDPAEVLEEVRRAIDQVNDLPAQVTDRPLFEERKSGSFPILEFAVYGDVSEIELYESAKLLERELEKVEGVARVDLFGSRDREWHVLVNPDALERNFLSLSEVNRSIAMRNVNIPGGTLARGKARNIRTTGEFENADEILSLPVRSNDIGGMIRVRSFATVSDTFERPEFLASVEGKPAINLLVLKKVKADILRTAARVNTAIEAAEGKAAANGAEAVEGYLPDAVSTLIINDESKRTAHRLDVVQSNALLGFALVVLILMAFLTVRDAVLTSLSLPFTLLGTLFVFPAYDITFNLVSMLGIIISLGMLVDNSIVISENIYRYREEGLDPEEASARGASELVVPIIGTYLTTIAAFAPMLVMSGLMGKFVWQIPFVVICTLSVSLIESFFLLPARVARFGKSLQTDAQPRRHVIRNAFDTGFTAIRNGFEWFVALMVRRRYISFGGIIGLLILAIFLQTQMKFNLFPREGVEAFIVKVEFEPGVRVQDTMQRMEYVENLIRRIPDDELESYTVKAGIQQQDSQDILTRVGEHLGMVQVFLTPELQRDRLAKDIIAGFEDELNQIPDAVNVFVEEVVPSPPIGAAVTLAVEGDDYDTLQKIADDVKAFLRNDLDGVRNIADDYNPGREEYVIRLDEGVAARAGVDTLQAAQLIRTAYEGNEVATIRRGTDEITIRVLYDDAHRGDVDALGAVRLVNRSGLHTELRTISRTEVRTGPESLRHFDFERAVTVTADVDDAKITSVEANAAVFEKFANISTEYPGYAIRFRGEQKSTEKSMASLARAGVVAFFAIYAILAVIFKSALKPLIISLTLPLGLIGVSIGFLTAGKALSFFAMIGMIGLAGVVVNSSIVLVDFIEQLQREGRDRYTALSEAAGIRFRPILLTTLTTMAGLLPTAYGIGGSDPVLIPMTLALAWGLSTGTFGALILIPCMFAIGYDIQDFLGRRMNGGSAGVSSAQVSAMSQDDAGASLYDEPANRGRGRTPRAGK